MGETVAKSSNFLLAKRLALGFGNFVELALVDDVYGAFGAHDGDFRGGPGEIGVRSNMFRSHDAVRTAVGFARYHGNFRNSGFGVSEEQLCAVLDDAAKFLLGAGEKTGNILEGDERNVEGVAETDKARALHGSVNVENAGEKRRLIADDADGAAVEAVEADDKIFRVMFVDFEEISIVNNRVEDVLDVVWHLGIGGNQGVERIIAASRGGLRGAAGGVFEVVRKEKTHQLTGACPANRPIPPGAINHAA